MKGKWTPGPWAWNERDAFDDGGNDQCAARISAPSWEALARVVVRFEGDSEDDPQGVANAHLIAAAPALYEALEKVLADIAEYERVNKLAPNPGRSDCWDSVTDARAALTQARGEQP